MRSVSDFAKVLLALLAVGLLALEPGRPTPIRATELPNVLVVGWDGTQWNHLQQCRRKELPECPDGLPNLEALGGGVVRSSTTTNAATATKPGWAQILSGYNAEVTGVYDNQAYQPIPEGYTVFEKLEKRLGDENIYTALVSGKGYNTGGDPGFPWYNAKFGMDYFYSKPTPIDEIGAMALDVIEAHASELFFAGFIFAFPDGSGHAHGENSPEYAVDMVHVDQWLGQIVNKLELLGIYDQTIIAVTTDHGFDENGDFHFNAPYGFLATNDPLVTRNADRKDIAPTILQRFGILDDPSGETPPLNGYSLLEPLPFTCVAEGAAYIDGPGAPACCAGLELINLDKDMFSRRIKATGGHNNHSGYCTDCGDGACSLNENRYNCAADCPQKPVLLNMLISNAAFGE